MSALPTRAQAVGWSVSLLFLATRAQAVGWALGAGLVAGLVPGGHGSGRPQHRVRGSTSLRLHRCVGAQLGVDPAVVHGTRVANARVHPARVVKIRAEHGQVVRHPRPNDNKRDGGILEHDGLRL